MTQSAQIFSHHLFQYGKFSLSSRRQSRLKLECNALTSADLDTCALLLQYILPAFDFAVGVSTGGDALAYRMQAFQTVETLNPRQILIIDDVFTTGASICKERDKLKKKGPTAVIFGAVIFARAPTPAWVTALFTLNSQLSLI